MKCRALPARRVDRQIIECADIISRIAWHVQATVTGRAVARRVGRDVDDPLARATRHVARAPRHRGSRRRPDTGRALPWRCSHHGKLAVLTLQIPRTTTGLSASRRRGTQRRSARVLSVTTDLLPVTGTSRCTSHPLRPSRPGAGRQGCVSLALPSAKLSRVIARREPGAATMPRTSVAAHAQMKRREVHRQASPAKSMHASRVSIRRDTSMARMRSK